MDVSKNVGKLDLGPDAKTMQTSWTFKFDLDQKTNPGIAPLLGTDGFIDGNKLLGVEVIALYEGTVSWSESSGGA